MNTDLIREAQIEALADDILLSVLDWASQPETCECGAVFDLHRAFRIIACTPYLNGTEPMKSLTRAEREIEARKRVCPKCHCEANRPCRYRNPGANPFTFPGRPMKGIHAERLALVTP